MNVLKELAVAAAEAMVVNDEPTVHPDIVYRNGRYVATGIDPYWDANMSKRIKWMHATNGGKDIPAGDDSLFALEVQLMLLLQKDGDDKKASSIGSDDGHAGSGSGYKHRRFTWLGEPGTMKYTGLGDAHRCSDCDLEVSYFVPGDTFLNQHTYFTEGDCPYLNAAYAAEELKIAIGQERFRRGFVVHPNAITVPGPKVILTFGIYVTLAEGRWCYMCGHITRITTRIVTEKYKS